MPRWTPPAEPLPTSTPPPAARDEEIERRARQLAECRSDLTTGQIDNLAGILAYRTRVYRTGEPE